MHLTHNAVRVLESRYLHKDAEGNLIEAPDGLFRRVARHIAKAELKFGEAATAEKWEEIFYQLMTQLKFLPNSPTLMNAGLELNQLSACFVLPVEDSIDSIFTTLKNMALIQQSGGGTGFNFSKLRAKGSYISTTSGISSGPLAFMKVFDGATQHIKQGGKRRGANMGILNVDHPDIAEFISAKREEGVLCNFNISVGICDDFMKAVKTNGKWDLKDPLNRKTVRTVNAMEIWDLITENAWHTGDPGLIFFDTINEFNPTPTLGTIDCTNPCGEIPLLPFEACNLGSINLTKYVKKGEINWHEIGETVYEAVRFLDNVIEMNQYVVPEIEHMVKGNRKIGLGIMGWAEFLILLNIPYASEEALLLAEEVMSFIKEKSMEASGELAKLRGNFKNWEKSIFYPDRPMRNATRTCIAPTGTISIIAGTSSSIEPLFALAFKRENVLNEESLEEVNGVFVQYLNDNGIGSDELISLVANTGSILSSDLPDRIKNIFKTSLEIPPKWHVQHQVAFQKHTDNAVSKTINLPFTATVQDISDAYLLAWEMKAKGVTVFRWGSKGKQVVSSGLDHQAVCHVCAT